MNYIYIPPPNTKAAQATKNGHTLIVECPHCCKKHYHPLVDRYRLANEAHCKLGYYTIRVAG